MILAKLLILPVRGFVAWALATVIFAGSLGMFLCLKESSYLGVRFP